MAERYLEAVEETCALLVTAPRSGSPHDSGIESLVGLRRVSVKGFKNYLLFYVPGASGIVVIRILHAARDIEHILAADEG